MSTVDSSRSTVYGFSRNAARFRSTAAAAFSLGLLLGGALPSQSQTAAPAPSKTRAHVQTLASEKL